MSKIDYRYTLSEDEREKITNDIHVGIWRIEQAPDQPPLLFGDANMYAILGAAPEMPPEALYQHWYARIEPVYLSYIDKAIERLIRTSHPVEVEYTWNHPQLGKTLVRCDATLSSSSPDGKIVILGMHRDITNKLVSSFSEGDGYHIVDHYKMSLCGRYLINAYEHIFYVDQQTRTLHPVLYRGDHCLAAQDSLLISDVIEKHVSPADREEVYSLFSDAALNEIAAKGASLSVDFRSETSAGPAYVRGILYPISINGVDEFIFVIQNVQNEHKLKVLEEQKEDLLYSIIHTRSVIYEWDTQSHRMQLLKHDIYNLRHSLASANMSLPELLENLCSRYVDLTEWPKVMTFLSYENISRCVETQRKESIVLLLDSAYHSFDWVKIYILPSVSSKTKAYIMLELMDRKEGLYPILESYIRESVDHCYCIDLKRGHFFRLFGDDKTYGMPPLEGHNYTQAVLAHTDRFIAEEDRALVKKQMDPKFILSILEAHPEFSFVENMIGEHGEIQKKRLTYRPIHLPKGYVLLQREDITEMNNLLETAQREAMTDPLTQLYNRLGGERQIKEALFRMSADETAVMILLDLDNFKVANDRFGHPMGDYVLREAAQKLRACFRTCDIICRLGGDEYIVFLKNLLHKSDIHHVLNRVVNEMRIVCESETDRFVVTASVGATFYHGQSYEELYRESDAALYYAKKQKSRYFLFDDMQ